MPFPASTDSQCARLEHVRLWCKVTPKTRARAAGCSPFRAGRIALAPRDQRRPPLGHREDMNGEAGVGFTSVGFDPDTPIVLPEWLGRYAYLQIERDTDWRSVVTGWDGAIASGVTAPPTTTAPCGAGAPTPSSGSRVPSPLSRSAATSTWAFSAPPVASSCRTGFRASHTRRHFRPPRQLQQKGRSFLGAQE